MHCENVSVNMQTVCCLGRQEPSLLTPDLQGRSEYGHRGIGCALPDEHCIFSVTSEFDGLIAEIGHDDNGHKIDLIRKKSLNGMGNSC